MSKPYKPTQWRVLTIDYSVAERLAVRRERLAEVAAGKGHTSVAEDHALAAWILDCLSTMPSMPFRWPFPESKLKRISDKQQAFSFAEDRTAAAWALEVLEWLECTTHVSGKQCL